MKKNLRLVQKQVQKQKQKMTATLKYVAVGVACTAIISGVAFVYFNVGQSEDARANTATIKDPVKLRYFEAEPLNETVSLKWRTLIEVEHDHFTIERSPDGEMYEPIAVIQGAGFSDSRKDYSYIDSDPLNGESYYRLGKTDFDGHTLYSEPIKVSVSKLQPVKILSGGKNANGLTQIVFLSATKSDVTIKLTDVAGRQVFSDIIKPVDGQNTYTFEDKGKLAPGVYSAVVLQDSNQSNIFKVVKTQ